MLLIYRAVKGKRRPDGKEESALAVELEF